MPDQLCHNRCGRTAQHEAQICGAWLPYCCACFNHEELAALRAELPKALYLTPLGEVMGRA